jgi:adenylate cyclase
LVSNSIILEKAVFDEEVVRNLLVFVSQPAFWNIILFMGLLFSFTLFHSGMTDYVGQNVLINYLFGKYHHPREEHRIFLFLDLRSSTSIAEQLGHDIYFEWLNEYYADVTAAIIESGGQIYQYVGDELVVTWNYRHGLEDNNCLRCFFRCQEMIKAHHDKYLTRYGHVPQFKAGLHGGHVTTGKIGVIKKEIVFTGDVLNTAARIQGLCNQYKASLLVSEALLRHLEYEKEFEAAIIGEITLRGKDEPVRLYGVSERTSQS